MVFGDILGTITNLSFPSCYRRLQIVQHAHIRTYSADLPHHSVSKHVEPTGKRSKLYKNCIESELLLYPWSLLSRVQLKKLMTNRRSTKEFAIYFTCALLGVNLLSLPPKALQNSSNSARSPPHSTPFTVIRHLSKISSTASSMRIPLVVIAASRKTDQLLLQFLKFILCSTTHFCQHLKNSLDCNNFWVLRFWIEYNPKNA